MLGTAVLFASVVGLDAVEQRKGDIAAISGVPTARVQEIVDTGRQALSSASPKVPEQHVVSQAILRRFLGPASPGDQSPGGQLLAYNLRYGKAKLRAPRGPVMTAAWAAVSSAWGYELRAVPIEEVPSADDELLHGHGRAIVGDLIGFRVMEDAVLVVDATLLRCWTRWEDLPREASPSANSSTLMGS